MQRPGREQPNRAELTSNSLTAASPMRDRHPLAWLRPTKQPKPCHIWALTMSRPFAGTPVTWDFAVSRQRPKKTAIQQLNGQRNKNKSQTPISGVFATTPDLGLSRGFWEDTTILKGGTP